MSVKAMAAVWDMEIKDPAEKFVLLAYADHADHQGGSIYPAVATIAQKTGYDERSVRRIAHRLVESGRLIPNGKGAKGTIRYRIDLTQSQPNSSSRPDSGSGDSGSGGTQSPDPEGMPDLTLDTKRPDPGSANPSLTINEPSVRGGKAAAPDQNPKALTKGVYDGFSLPGSKPNDRLLNRLCKSSTEIVVVQTFLELLPLKLSEPTAKTNLSAAREILAGGGTADDVRRAFKESRPRGNDRGFTVTDLHSLKNRVLAMAAERRAKAETAETTPAYTAVFN